MRLYSKNGRYPLRNDLKTDTLSGFYDFHRFASHGYFDLISIMVHMNDEIKLVTAFLALNAGVIALVVAGYAKGGMNIGSVISHLGG